MTAMSPPEGLLEDFAVDGSGAEAKIGILFVHGFTGSPASMRPWAEFFAARGYTVRLPRLPGHGRKWQDLNSVSWSDWTDRIIKDLQELEKSCEKIFIFGLSMGGGATLYVAAKHVDKLAGLVLVNPMIHIPGVAPKFAPLVALFRASLPSVGGDIKRPGVSEWAYDHLPSKGVVQLASLLRRSRSTLGQVKVPLLLFHSVEDHVLPVSNTEIIMAEIGSTGKQRIELMNSYHVATIDYDSDFIFENSLVFVEDHS